MLQLNAIGYLGGDAVIRTNQAGDHFVTFSLAINEKKGDVTETVWLHCSTKKEELLPYLKKGTQVFIQGYPKLRAYPDKGGEPAASLDVLVSRVELLSPAKKENTDHSDVLAST